LFGSYARHDQNEASDIDVLQVTPNPSQSYSVGKINVTCYTKDQLLHMADAGSLFIRHIVCESVAIIDPERLLDQVTASFKANEDLGRVIREVQCSLGLLAVNQTEFEKNSHHYSATASYLLRTYVYARAFQSGNHTFSMRELARAQQDYKASQPLGDLRRSETYSTFRRVVDLLFRLYDTELTIRRESLEAYIVNSYGVCDVAVVLGLRILARGELIGYAHLRE
jgi:hypothetical protein